MWDLSGLGTRTKRLQDDLAAGEQRLHSGLLRTGMSVTTILLILGLTGIASADVDENLLCQLERTLVAGTFSVEPFHYSESPDLRDFRKVMMTVDRDLHDVLSPGDTIDVLVPVLLLRDEESGLSVQETLLQDRELEIESLNREVDEAKSARDEKTLEAALERLVETQLLQTNQQVLRPYIGKSIHSGQSYLMGVPSTLTADRRPLVLDLSPGQVLVPLSRQGESDLLTCSQQPSEFD